MHIPWGIGLVEQLLVPTHLFHDKKSFEEDTKIEKHKLTLYLSQSRSGTYVFVVSTSHQYKSTEKYTVTVPCKDWENVADCEDARYYMSASPHSVFDVKNGVRILSQSEIEAKHNDPENAFKRIAKIPDKYVDRILEKMNSLSQSHSIYDEYASKRAKSIIAEALNESFYDEILAKLGLK